MTLDIFDIKLGPDAKMPRLDADNTGLVAVQVLDAIQTVVDVLTDNDGKGGWKVGFDPTINAYTDRSANRRIVVSVKPLLDAKPGEPLSKVAAIMTGFAVHEVGHTKMDYYTAVKRRWPGKTLPLTLTNIIEDVVLELRTVERFPGFADNGNGNVFRPTLEWVAELTSPKTPLKWDGSTGHRVNVVGQMVRYRDFVTFDTDPVTQDALDFVETWAKGITADLTPKGCVDLIADLLAYLHATNEPEQPPVETPPLPPTGGQSIPDEDDEDGEDDTEGGSETDAPPTGDGEGEGKGDGGDADDADDADGGEGDDDADDGTEGDGDSDSDGDGEGQGQGTEGEDNEGEGQSDGESDESGPGREGDGNDADTLNRTEGGKGSNDGLGAGGSGQAVAEAGDEDPDAGFDPADLDRSFDDVAKDGQDTYQQRQVANAEADERVTTRLDAGAFGKMRVIFR